MKRILSAFLCVIMVFSVCISALAEIANNGNVLSSGKYYTKNGFLYNISVGTSPLDFLRDEPDIVSISSVGEFVATDDVAVDKKGNEFRVVVYGDMDCNGEISALDYLLLKRTVFKTYYPEGAVYEASKSGDEPSSYDYTLIKRHYFRTYDISNETHRTFSADGNGIKLAYIPLDNRPVNKERAEFLVAAAGFELLIPEEEMYRTALDNMTPNSDGSTMGNREGLLNWLKSIEDECDYFVISLDQLISGGLVGSRYLSNTDLTFEMKVTDYLIDLAKRKHVVIFDTVMRLASTVNYQGYDSATYNALRAYGQVARRQLNGSQLTVDNIIAGYRYNESGATISVNVSSTKLNQYLASRARKLKVVDYLLRNASEDIERIYIGVDDSSPQITIQTNEINYIKSIGGDNLTLFAGADELGLMGIAAVATSVYGQANCNVIYFGEGKDQPADAYDTSTLSNNVENHINSVGATMTSTDPNAMQVLVLTKTSDPEKYSKQLIETAINNIKNSVPTCIIDASQTRTEVARRMFDYDLDVGMLLGYSNWNTVGNLVGISLSNAVARYVYLYRSSRVTEESNKAFLKTLTFSLVKDISYKFKGISNLNDTSTFGPATIVARINASPIMSAKGKAISHGRVSVSNFRYPWNRTFEATFDISVA